MGQHETRTRQGWKRNKYSLHVPSRLHKGCLKPLALAFLLYLEGIFISLESEAALDRRTDKIACLAGGPDSFTVWPSCLPARMGVWGLAPIKN